MKYKRWADRICYSVEITREHLQLILDHDRTWPSYSGLLSMRLDAIGGLEESVYSEALGPYIFINIDYTDDSNQTWEKIEQIINDYTVHALLAQISNPSRLEVILPIR